MKLYLDMCSLQRPLDSKTQVRIILEAEAVLGIIDLCEIGQIQLMSSDILMFEAKNITATQRKAYVFEVLNKADIYLSRTKIVEQKAKELV